MTTTVVHCKQFPFDAYIGRPSPFGNPFSHKANTLAKYKVETREEAVQKYEEYLLTRLDLLVQLSRLKGLTLGCWCKPLSCHGDILAKFAEMDNFLLYCRLMNDRLSARRLGIPEAEDKILDEMDTVWSRMNKEEREYATKVGQSVNW